MTAARRVRSDMVLRGAQATYPRPAFYIVIEHPRVAVTDRNGRAIWEWRATRAVEIRMP